MSKVIKVLLISSEPYQHSESPLLGVFQKDVYEGLLLEGHEVGVISPAGRSLKYIKNIIPRSVSTEATVSSQILKNNGFNLFPRLRYLERLYFVFKGKKLFKQYVKQYGMPDIIHAHNALYAGVLAQVVANEASIPYVITEHSSWVLKGSYHGSSRRRIGHCYSDASVVTAVSHSLARKITDDYGVDDVAVVPNIIPAEFRDYKGPLKQRSIANPYYIHVASLDDNKNQRLLLKSFKAVLDAKPGARLCVIGDGPNKRQLSALALDLGMDQSVEFIGVKTRSEVAKLLAKSDVFLLTSLFETFGVVAIEAQAMGLPVVSTPCGGVSDIIEQGVNGHLSSGFDVDSYVNEIREVDKLLVNLDKAKLRNDTLWKYGPEVIAKSLTSIYKAALSD